MVHIMRRFVCVCVCDPLNPTCNNNLSFCSLRRVTRFNLLRWICVSQAQSHPIIYFSSFYLLHKPKTKLESQQERERVDRVSYGWATGPSLTRTIALNSLIKSCTFDGSFLPSQNNTTMQLQRHFLYIRKPTLVSLLSHIRYLTNQKYCVSSFLFLENI